MAKQDLLPSCEMCAQRSAQLTLEYFGIGEGFDLCPACLTLKQSFDALIEEINERQVSEAVIREKALVLLGEIGKRCGSAGVEFFKELFAEYDVAL